MIYNNKLLNQPQYPLIVDKLNKFWHIHVMEYNTVVKKEKVQMSVCAKGGKTSSETAK